MLADFINLPFHSKTIASDCTIWISGGNGLFFFEGKDFFQKGVAFSDPIISEKGKIIHIEDHQEPN